MGRPRIKWGRLQRYFQRHGYEIRFAGGEIVVVSPIKGPDGLRPTVKFGHTSCNSAGAEILKCYESKLRNVFGINLDDID
jgi:hypothetical protein